MPRGLPVPNNVSIPWGCPPVPMRVPCPGVPIYMEGFHAPCAHKGFLVSSIRLHWGLR